MAATGSANTRLKIVILTYHSHHVVGDEYGQNDHMALPEDLELICAAGFEIISLAQLIDAMFLPTRPTRGTLGAEARLVALTFDDGPVYDVADFTHPKYGRQKSFLNAMRDFRARHGRTVQPGLHATSFVIASPVARKIIEDTFDAQYTYMEPRSMEDDWWLPAIDTGLIAIANHSWDHLHPALPEIAHSRQARGDFTQVLSAEDADAQIKAAARFIASRTNGRAEPLFAYPFGHYNDYLVNSYFPQHGEPMVRAALSVDARAASADDSIWCLPRYVCGDDWRTPDELLGVLSG